MKSTKRAAILGTAFDCYYKHVSHMPTWSKLEFCTAACDWAGQDCCCQNRLEFDEVVEDEEDEISVDGNGNGNGNGDVVLRGGVGGVRIPLPWEILQPILRILGHCLLGPLNSQEVKDMASVAVRRLYARASHDLVPQAIIATRSLIQLDKRGRAAAKANAAAATVAGNSSSNVTTPSKVKKPEILLVSK